MVAGARRSSAPPEDRARGPDCSGSRGCRWGLGPGSGSQSPSLGKPVDVAECLGALRRLCSALYRSRRFRLSGWYPARRGNRCRCPPPIQKQQALLEQQLSDAGHEREVLHGQIDQRDKEIAELRHQLEQQSAETVKLKLTQDQISKELHDGQTQSQELLQQKADLSQRLDAALGTTQMLQGKLDSLQRQSSEDKQRATTLEARATDLTRLLREREGTIDKQQELLSDDRDIRELMGARDLYVVEVYDVEKSGRTRKPYGRMFYTKDKSVVFYAYDLDQQKGLQNASTFQAWGQRGTDWRQALNLGIFYVDNASKKRWVLRFDDPKVLAEIDAVFVTVEPHGGSQKPTNKPLLFSYLHMEPNHP